MDSFIAFLCGVFGALLGNLVSDWLGAPWGVELLLSLLFTLLLLIIRFLLLCLKGGAE